MEQRKIETIHGTGVCWKLFSSNDPVRVEYKLSVYREVVAVPTKDDPERESHGRVRIIGDIKPVCFVDSEIVLELAGSYARLFIKQDGSVEGRFSEKEGN